jgi:hypothetical protein
MSYQIIQFHNLEVNLKYRRVHLAGLGRVGRIILKWM